MGLISRIRSLPLLQFSLTNKITTEKPKPPKLLNGKKICNPKEQQKEKQKERTKCYFHEQQKPQKENPFETIWSRHKFDILGRKRKGEEICVGLSRSRGIEKRKKTLCKEYEQSWNASSFVDKRIGEKNEKLHEFYKGIMRSQRERQRTNHVKLKWQQVAKLGTLLLRCSTSAIYWVKISKDESTI